MKPKEYLCAVQSFRMLTETVFELNFDTEHPLLFKAGQFISIIIPGAGPQGRDLRRAYSIASPPETHPRELCIKLVEGGPGTQYLYRLRPGDTFRALASYGDFVYREIPEKDACFIATGTGIAPFRSMVLSENYKKNPPAQSYCLFGVRTENELLYTEDFSQIKGLKFIQAVSQPQESWSGFKGRVSHYLRGLEKEIRWTDTEFYLCGNGSMISEVKAILADRGVPKSSIHQEIYYR